jgi:hypothetical protein
MHTQTYQPQAPEARDRTARILLTIVLVISVINLLLLGYVFVMVQHAADLLQDFG